MQRSIHIPERSTTCHASSSTTPPSLAGGRRPTHEPDGEDIVVETVKQAEEGGDLIVRLYEAAGGGRTAELRVGMPVREVHLVDLMERRTRELPARDGRISLEFGPYEIHTIALTPDGKGGG